MSLGHLGHFLTTGSRTHVRFQFSTHASAGGNVAPNSAFEAADIRIYRANDSAAFSATQRSSANGITMTSPFDSLTGVHDVDIDLADNTDAGFYADGYTYTVMLAPDETVDSQTLTGVVLAMFAIGTPPANVIQWLGTAAATPTVAGVPEVDVTHWIGTAAATPTVAGVPEVDVTHWLGTAAQGASGRPQVDVELIEGADPSDTIRDSIVDDATRIDASALNTLSSHDPGETIMGATDLGTGAGLTTLATQASVNTIDDFLDTEINAIKTKTDFLPSATVGTAGGLLIVGNNAATAFTGGLTITQSASNQPGLSITGNGTAPGVALAGGATGNGLTIDGQTGVVITSAAGVGVEITATGGSGIQVFSDGVAVTLVGTTGGVALTGDLAITGDMTLSGALELDSVSVTNAVVFDDHFTVGGNFSVGGNVVVTGTVGTGAVTFATLNVTGATQFGGAVSFDGTTTFGGAVSFGDTVTFDGAVSFESGLSTSTLTITADGPQIALGIIDQGTAQAVTGTTIRLRSAAAFADDTLIGSFIAAHGSTQGYWQVREITDNALTNDVVTVDTWTVTPSGTITYVIFAHVASAGGGGGGNTAQEIADALKTAPAVGSPDAGSVYALLNTIDDFLDTEVLAIKAKTDNLPSDPADASDISGAFTTVNTKLDTIITNTGSLSGSGARTVTVTVNDGSSALQNAKVRLTLNDDTYMVQTNASGVAVFSLDDGTYNIAITYPGYQFTPTTLVVSGNTSTTKSMTQVSIPAPSAPDLCHVVGLILLPDGNPATEVDIIFRLKANRPSTSGGGIVTTEPFVVTTDEDGEVDFELTRTDEFVLPNAYYEVTCNELKWQKKVLALGSATFDLSSL